MRRPRVKTSLGTKFYKLLKCIFQVLIVTFLLTTLMGVSTIHSHDADYYFPLTKTELKLEELSSVDYFACCGLGHRLIRMSLAHFVAKKKGFALRSFWGWCGERDPIEVFSYLFEPQPAEELSHVRSQGIILPFYNEVPGFVTLGRNPNKTPCPCHEDKIVADLELYTSLRNRFRDIDRVDSYVNKYFQNRTVIGIHVRAGNGEEGDFIRKGRAIDDPHNWVRQVSQTIRDFLQGEYLPSPPALYVATDTPSMVSLFRQEFVSANIEVLECPQELGRRGEGEGVLFGVSNKVNNKDGNSEDDSSSCLLGWTSTLLDMFLLSHADVIVAAKPSSFSQTAPMSFAFGNRQPKLSKAYCEVIPRKGNNDSNSTDDLILQCYDSYLDWCCNYATWISIKHKASQGHKRVFNKEFVKFMDMESLSNFSRTEYRTMRHRIPNCPRPRRGRAGGGLKDKCLP